MSNIGGLPLLDRLGALPTGKGDPRGSSLRPLFTPFKSGSIISPVFSHYLPISPMSQSSHAVTDSAAISGGGGPSAQTPSAGQQPADCEDSGIFWCWHLGSLTLRDIGPGSVSGTLPIPVSNPRWRAGGMRQWSGYIFRQGKPCSSPCLSRGSAPTLRSSLGVGTRWSDPPPSCALSSYIVIIDGNTTSYIRLLWKKSWSLILVSVSIIRSKLPICTAWMACTITDPRLLQMFKVPRESPQGCVVNWRGVSGALWRWSLPWLIGRARQMVTPIRSLKNMSHIDLRSFYFWSGSVP